ncbi:MAG TPA: HK97 family phage prohead protease [Vicinamibacteria bacterium]|nr:HK97 family phage prohead protease [Vicinamibacteria bacterium]
MDALREVLSMGLAEIAEGERAGTFEGVAASLGVASSAHGPVRFSPEALRAAPAEVVLLRGHDREKVLGTARLSFDPQQGLLVHGKLVLALQDAREIRALLAEGVANGLSVGFTDRKSHYEGNTRVIDAADISEVSVVTVPADPCATVKHFHRGESVFDSFDAHASGRRFYEDMRTLQAAAQSNRSGFFG